MGRSKVSSVWGQRCAPAQVLLRCSLSCLLAVAAQAEGLAAAQATGSDVGGAGTVGMVAKFESKIRRLASTQALSTPGGKTVEVYRTAVQGKMTNFTNFVHYSSYRLSPSRFVSAGLARRLEGVEGVQGVTLDTLSKACSWEDAVSKQAHRGEVTVHRTDWHPNEYIVAIIFCDIPTLDAPPEQEKATRQEPPRRKARGGSLRLSVGPDSFTALEQKTEQEIHRNTSKGPFQWDVAFCGPPFFGDLEPLSIVQWSQYHLSLGVQHLFFYDAGGLSAAARSLLEPLLKARRAEVVDFREQEQYDKFYHAQSLSANDCLYRNRGTSSWLLFSDLDEYLDTSIWPPVALKGFLRHKQEEEYTWLSLGVIIHPPLCEEEVGEALWTKEGSMAVEWLRLREPHPVCNSDWAVDVDVCPGLEGRRKLLLNPRHVEVTEVHTMVKPISAKGLHVPISSGLLLAHFQGMTIAGYKCSKASNASQYKVVDFVAQNARSVPRISA